MASAPQNEAVYSGFPAFHPHYQLTEYDINRSQLTCDIGKKWRKLARMLEFKKAAIDAIESENESHSERCFDLLVRWLQKEGQRATAEKLAEALKKIELQILADRLIDPSNGRRTICIEIEGTMELDNAKQTQVMIGRDSAGEKKFFVWENEEKKFNIEDLRNCVNATIDISVTSCEEKEDSKVPEANYLTAKVHHISEELELLEKRLSNIASSLEIPELKEESYTIPKKLDLLNRQSRTLQEFYTKVTGMTGEACKCNESVRRNFYDFAYHSLRAVHNDLCARVADLQSEEASMRCGEKEKLKQLISYQRGREKQIKYLEGRWIRLFSTPEAQLQSSRSKPEREIRKPSIDAKYERSLSEGIISRKSKFPFMKRKSENEASSVRLLSYSETGEGNSSQLKD